MISYINSFSYSPYSHHFMKALSPTENKVHIRLSNHHPAMLDTLSSPVTVCGTKAGDTSWPPSTLNRTCIASCDSWLLKVFRAIPLMLSQVTKPTNPFQDFIKNAVPLSWGFFCILTMLSDSSSVFVSFLLQQLTMEVHRP
jgi:hypothetical protein